MHFSSLRFLGVNVISTVLQECPSTMGMHQRKHELLFLSLSPASVIMPLSFNLFFSLSLPTVSFTVCTLSSLFLCLFVSRFVCISLSAITLYTSGCINLPPPFFLFFSHMHSSVSFPSVRSQIPPPSLLHLCFSVK